MNVFTGGCHYDQNCGGYVKSCGACPQLGSTDEQDLSRQVWTRKRGVFAGRGEKNIQFVANSYWLEAEAKRSSLLSRFPVTTIHYGLDTRTFSPRDRIFSRSVLDLPADAAVVLFVADSVDNKRKGFALLAEALGKLKDRSDLFLLSLGYGNPSLPDTIRHMHLGVVSDDRFLSLIYSAADVFVIPSLQEAFGQTALEAIACGTPVIGFDVGGIPDTVIPRVTGLLVPPGDVDALRSAIVELLEDHAGRKAMSANCRRVAVEKFALDIQARQYVELYESLTRGSAELQITAQTAAECVGQSDSKSLHSYPVL
jgi:glycosyltransferase involved in cell wall biosynthesis